MNKKLSQRNLLHRFKRNLKKTGLIQRGDKIIVAVSGGPDSVCLFDILYKLREKLGIELSVCHYNHKMRGDDSNADQDFVEKLCGDRGVELKVGAYEGKRALKSEEEAREARYAFFEKILEEERGAKLALAHNADDLSETLVFRLVRGSGPKGLKSIPPRRKKFIRPLLDFSKDEILKYLEDEGLSYCLDSSNKDTKYSRNYIRHSIFPSLKTVNSKAIHNIYRFSKILEEQNDYIDLVVKDEMKKIANIDNKKVEIDLDQFKKLHKMIQSGVIISSATSLGYGKDIGQNHIESILSMIEKGEGQKYLTLPHSLRVKIKSGKIYLS